MELAISSKRLIPNIVLITRLCLERYDRYIYNFPQVFAVTVAVYYTAYTVPLQGFYVSYKET